jgi:hypothetical protein
MSKTFSVGDEVKLREDVRTRLGIIAGNPGSVKRVTHNGAVVHVYVYPWKRTYVYAASDLESRPA